jgi:hypothetical protein
MKHNVAFELDLTNPDEANVYNAIRNLDGIKNAISQFRKALNEMKEEMANSEGKAVLAGEIAIVEGLLLKAFGDNGVTI